MANIGSLFNIATNPKSLFNAAIKKTIQNSKHDKPKPIQSSSILIKSLFNIVPKSIQCSKPKVFEHSNINMPCYQQGVNVLLKG